MDTPRTPPPRKPPPLRRASVLNDAAGPLPFSAGTSVAPHLINEIEPFALQSLREKAIDPVQFQWLLPVASISLNTGSVLEGGWVARLASGAICVFRYGRREGFQLAQAPEATPTAITSADGALSLVLSLPQPSSVDSCVVAVNPSVCKNGNGPWLEFWRTALAQVTQLESAELVALVEAETISPSVNQFGPKVDRRPTPVLLAIRGTACATVPSIPLPALGECQAWYADGSGIEICTDSTGIPSTLRLTPRVGRDAASLVDCFVSKLPAERRGQESARVAFKDVGVFRAAAQSTVLVLRRVTKGDVRVEGSGVGPYRFFCNFGKERTSLATQDGDSLMLMLDEAQAAASFADLVPLRESVSTTDSNAKWILATTPDVPDAAIRLSLTAAGLSLGATAAIPLSDSVSITAVDGAAGMLSLCVASPLLGAEPLHRTFVTTESMGYAFWAEFDTQKTALGVASAGIADLYRQFNEAKKYNVLLVMFGDVLILNRALDSGLPMHLLVRKLDEVGAVAFAESGELRDATVKKILTLSVALPEIKQRFEMLAAMAPYYWASTETDWLAATFAGVSATPSAATERKRIVPRVRRQLRLVQGDLLRSLSQIEACIRPLESMLARDEVRQSRPARIARYAPVVVQVGLGITAIMTGGAGLMAANLLGGALATHGLGNVLAYFQKDREAAAQIRKVAEQVFPWWDVFMRTLVVSIFETAEFVDEENLLATQRDKKLLSTLPEDSRPRLLKTIQGQLRKRIVAERRNRFGEILDGSGIRLSHIIADMEHAIGPGMRGTVDEFMGSVIVSGRKPVREVSK